ncbi:MAG: alpha-ketoacid dehydrogenase subunit beta [Elusimicrobia bacterium]|nr:alpha-ketoacid dehydrogenase subunit beta [Elusimicrobiota bacterium]
MPELNLAQAVNQGLRQAMETDPNVIILGKDVGRKGGIFRVTEGLQQSFGEDRVMDTPLAELGILGASIGLAMAGMRPVCEIQYDGFMPSVLEQAICHLGRLRSRSCGKRSVGLVVRSPHGGGLRAPELHSESPEAYFAHTPGLKVVMPSTPEDAKGLIIAAIFDSDPVIFFEPKSLYLSLKGEVPTGPYETPIGMARLAREGTDISIVAWGSMVHTALRAAAILAEQDNVSAEVLDLRTLTPIDIEALVATASKTGRVVVCHEAPNTGSWAAEVSCLIHEKALLKLQAPVRRVGGWDIRMPAFKLEKYYIPDEDRVIKAVRETLSY